MTYTTRERLRLRMVYFLCMDRNVNRNNKLLIRYLDRRESGATATAAYRHSFGGK